MTESPQYPTGDAVRAGRRFRRAVVLGGAGQVAGILLYFWTMWTRIRAVGSQIREAKGERF